MSSPLSGFTAVPNPQMLAFMGAQSFVMMFQAGEGWQYGKRRISAMSNEDFNKLTPERLLQNQAATLRSSLGTIEKSMNDMTPMIETIIRQYGDFMREIIRVTPSVSLSVTGGRTPEQIVQQTVPSATGSERQALADFIRSLQSLVPKSLMAGGETGGIIGEGLVQGPPAPSKKLVLPSAGTLTRGFLGGPAPKTSIAQKFRTFEATRNPQQKLLAEMQKNLSQLVSQMKAMIKNPPGGRGSSRYITQQWQKRFQSIRNNISALERQIVLQKVKINRR